MVRYASSARLRNTERIVLWPRMKTTLGLDGVLLIFLSFYDDTIRFGKEIVPLLKQMDVMRSMDAHPVASGL